MLYRLRLVSYAVMIFILCFSCISLSQAEPNREIYYQKESLIDPQVAIQDKGGSEHQLLDLIKAQEKEVTVIYIFGGGAMGAKAIPRGIWCQDSYEDLHILRSLVDVYSDRVGFIAIAVPPVFHTTQMGFVDRAFLDFSNDDEQYENAYEAFLRSNQEALNKGLLPIEPFFDIGFKLLMSDSQQEQLSEAYGNIPDWQGSFRDPNEQQTYGVPAFWIVDDTGLVLTEPYRGNVYHPHGDGDITLNYSLNDILEAINDNLPSKK